MLLLATRTENLRRDLPNNKLIIFQVIFRDLPPRLMTVNTEVHGDPGGRSPLQRAGAFEL